MTILEQRDTKVTQLSRLRQTMPPRSRTGPYQAFPAEEQRILAEITELEAQLPPGYYPWPCLPIEERS